MGLNEEIKENAKKVHTNEMKMSIGEIINLYDDGDIIIRPEFQRLFRWEIDQKSKFIESILIGIPIPPIFVQQLDDGRWEVIDGLQRLSTILEFVGVLKDEHDALKEPIYLQKTKYLPSLENTYYDKFDTVADVQNYFDREVKLIFKRTPVTIEIIKRESDLSTKYELFDRLNSGGSSLTAHEIRNAIYLNKKPNAIGLFKKLSEDENFINATNLSSRDINEAYNEELVLRFFAYANISDKLSDYNDSIKEFLDGYINDYFDDSKIGVMEAQFKSFFELMLKVSEKVFHGKKAGFSIAKYEALVIGLNKYIAQVTNANFECFKNKIQRIQDEQWFIDATRGNSFARKRLKAFNENASSYFEDCLESK